MDLNELKKEIPYRWRVQSIKYGVATCVAYIDSRDLMDLLDEVVGISLWQCNYKEVNGNVYCSIGIKPGDEWVWKEDCGIESNMDKEKGEASDAFKRAGVKWGAGRFLYRLGIIKLKTAPYKDKEYPADNNGKPIFSGDDLTNFINSKTPIKPEKTLGKTKPVVPKSEFSKICREYFTKYGDQCSIALYEFGKGEYKVAKDIPLAEQNDFLAELKKLDFEANIPF